MGTVMRLYAAAAVIIFLAMANAVLAFDVFSNDDDNTITVKVLETGRIDATIKTDIDDVFIFSVIGEKPWMVIPVHMELSAGTSRTFSLIASPFATTDPATYKPVIIVESRETGNIARLPVTISVRSSDASVESISIENAAPAGTAGIELYLKNHEAEELTVLLEYEAAGRDVLLSKSEEIILAPGEFRIVQDSFEIPECYPAGTYSAKARILDNGVELSSIENQWQVPEKVIIMSERTDAISGLGTETGFLLRNAGNTRGIATVSENVWGSLFFSGNEPDDESDGRYIWKRELGPCESAVVGYNVNYTPVAGVFFLILGLWFVFFRLRSVRIRKNILQKSIIQKGLEYTVGLHVKSYSRTKDIVVKDFVPPAFDIKDTPTGIKPERCRKAGGTELIWRVPHMSTHEERILTYKLVPLFSVSGKVRLPRAHVSFIHLGREMLRMSPIVHLGQEIAHSAEEAEGSFLRSFVRVFRFGR